MDVRHPRAPRGMGRGSSDSACAERSSAPLLAILVLHANEVVSTDRLHRSALGRATGRTRLRFRCASPSCGRRSAVRRARWSRSRRATRSASSARSSTCSGSSSSSARSTGAEPEIAAASACVRRSALWRGQPLADFAYETFAQPAIARLEELRLVALERRIDADLALGRHADARRRARGARRGSIRSASAFARQLMLALYRSGRQADALAVYRRARTTLVDELGIEPSTRAAGARAGDPPTGSGSSTRRAAARRSARSCVAPLDGKSIRRSGRARRAARPSGRARADPGSAHRLGERSGGGERARQGAPPGPPGTRYASPGLPPSRPTVPRADLVRHRDRAGRRSPPHRSAPMLCWTTKPCEHVLAARHRATWQSSSLATRSRLQGQCWSRSRGAEHDWAAVELGAWIARSPRVSLAARRPRREWSRCEPVARACVARGAASVGCRRRAAAPRAGHGEPRRRRRRRRARRRRAH